MLPTNDFAFALRRLRRAPGFAAAVVLMLGLGIGLAVAMFGVVRGVLGALPYPGGDRVVAIDAVNPKQGAAAAAMTPAEAERLEADDPQSPFQHAGDFSWGGITVFDDQRPREITVGIVSDGFFPALGMAPAMGRWFTPEEYLAPQTSIVLSHDEWQRLLGGRAEAIGTRVDTVEGPRTVVGVMPAGFDFPANEVGAWIPRAPFDTSQPGYRFARTLYGVAWLKDGIDDVAVRERLVAMATEVREKQRLKDEGWGFATPSVLDVFVGDVRGTVWGAFAIALLVLLIACANVAILVDARQVAQRHEFTIAQALGASAAHLWRVRAYELLAMAIAGVVVGVLMAWMGLEAVRTLASDSVPRVQAIVIDPTVLGFAVLLGAFVPFAVMGVGAMRSSRSLVEGLRGGGRGTLEGSTTARRLLPGVAVALSTVCLIAAAALVLSLVRLAQVQPGFDVERVHALQLFRDGGPAAWPVFAEQMRERLSALPGADKVSITTSAPLSSIARQSMDVHADGRDTTEPVRALQRRVDGSYLDLLGIPLIAGRGIADTDRAGTERVAVISRALSRRLFGEASALDRTIRMAVGREGMLEYRVVGVAEDIHNDGLRSPPSPEILVSFAQHPWVGMTFLVRSRTKDTSMLKQMAEQAWAIDPRQAFTRQFLLADDLAGQLRPMRFFSVTMGTFAVCSLLLGAFGVYAVATLAQRRRVREFGLRLAVGARPTALGLQVLRDGLRVVLTGAAIGVAGSWFALQLIAAQTFGLERGIAWVMAIGAATMASAALIALTVPAWRAIRTDPMTALRYE